MLQVWPFKTEEKRKMELEESRRLTSDYTTKLHASKQYGTGTQTRNTDQWNRIERLEINPGIYCQFIYDREATIYNGERTDSPISGAGKTGQLHAKE